MNKFFVSIGYIIIDDIVLPDGTRKMDVLGGASTHAAMGMRLWTDRVGLVSGIGKDYAAKTLANLGDYSHTDGVMVVPKIKTPRAWQVFDVKGHRAETFQTDRETLIDLLPKPADLKDFYTKISGVHLNCKPEEVQSWTTHLREMGCEIILWEPWDEFCVPQNQTQFIENAKAVDFVSPNLREGRLLTGLENPLDVVRQLNVSGARVAVLRMGEKGSLISTHQGDVIEIPACPVKEVVDVTGAGNAYCGGFIVGYTQTGDLQQAGRYGAVSASFALEQFGALYSLVGAGEEASRRLAWYDQAMDK
jgi:sugar/nucleoside kinase (ribokinase family)